MVSPLKSSARKVVPAPRRLLAIPDAYCSTSPLALEISLSKVVGEEDVPNVVLTQFNRARTIAGISETKARIWPISMEPSMLRNNTLNANTTSMTAPVAGPRGHRCRWSQLTAGSSASARNSEISSSMMRFCSLRISHRATPKAVTSHRANIMARGSQLGMPPRSGRGAWDGVVLVGKLALPHCVLARWNLRRVPGPFPLHRTTTLPGVGTCRTTVRALGPGAVLPPPPRLGAGHALPRWVAPVSMRATCGAADHHPASERTRKNRWPASIEVVIAPCACPSDMARDLYS